jgi:putative transcriptional regulator
MNSIRTIREKLKLSQDALAKGLDCTQSNISFYERGQTVPPETAKKLIHFAASLGLRIGFDDIYGRPDVRLAKPRKPAKVEG